MALDKTEVVDIVATKPGASNALLLLVDDWEWDDEHGHLLALQEKLNTYIAYVEGGQLVRDYPTANGQDVAIQAKFLHLPPESVQAGFLSQAEQLLVNTGIEFEWSFEGAG